MTKFLVRPLHPFLVFCIMVLSFHVQAQCIEGDCLNGRGKEKCDCGYEYEGTYKDGEKVYGTMTKKDLVYTGEFQDDMAHGKGRMVHNDGSVYEGDFQFSLPDGFGKYELSNGYNYKGEVKKGLYQGWGMYYLIDSTNENTIITVGEFLEDKAQGIGFYKEFNGDVYLGTFDKGKFDGTGMYWYKDEKGFEIAEYRKGRVKEELFYLEAPQTINQIVKSNEVNYQYTYDSSTHILIFSRLDAEMNPELIVTYNPDKKLVTVMDAPGKLKFYHLDTYEIEYTEQEIPKVLKDVEENQED